MARKKIIAGNWKMNMTPSEAVELVNTLKPLVATEDADVVFCVPAIDIIPVMEAAKGSNIQVGAENMYFEEKGAYTGEISPNMLTDVGVKYVILGHSERREYFAETSETVNKKMLKAFEHGLTPIMCCGETLTQREQGVTMDFIRQQVKVGFLGVTAEQAKTAVIAYEPIWAISTGKTDYRQALGRIGGDLRAIYAGMPFGDLTAVEAVTLLADSYFNLFRHNLPLFFENMDKYFAGAGKALSINDYTQPIEDLYGIYQGNPPDNTRPMLIQWLDRALTFDMTAQLRARLLMLLAENQQKTGDSAKAKQSLNQAFIVCAGIPEEAVKVQLQNMIREKLNDL